jgi:hypothetical protein
MQHHRPAPIGSVLVADQLIESMTRSPTQSAPPDPAPPRTFSLPAGVGFSVGRRYRPLHRSADRSSPKLSYDVRERTTAGLALAGHGLQVPPVFR